MSTTETCHACHMPAGNRFFAGPDGHRYCSEWCYRTHDAESIERLPDRELPGLWQEMMRVGCANCPKPPKQICYGVEKPITIISKDRVEAITTMTWDGKAADIIGLGISDGSVPFSVARRLVAACEDLARSKGLAEVTIGDVTEVYVRSIADFGYQAPDTLDPEFTAAVAAIPSPGAVISSAKAKAKAKMAASRGDLALRERQITFMKSTLDHQGCVHDLLEERPVHWCSHTPHFLARLLAEPGFKVSDATQLFEAAEAVATERSHPGVLPADLHIALLRNVTAEDGGVARQ